MEGIQTANLNLDVVDGREVVLHYDELVKRDQVLTVVREVGIEVDLRSELARELIVM